MSKETLPLHSCSNAKGTNERGTNYKRTEMIMLWLFFLFRFIQIQMLLRCTRGPAINKPLQTFGGSETEEKASKRIWLLPALARSRLRSLRSTFGTLLKTTACTADIKPKTFP